MKKTDALYNGQSIHITVGYHKFPPTQHLLRCNWIDESKMRKRTQRATATPHMFFFSSLLPSLPQEAIHFLIPPLEYHGKKILHWGLSCWTLAQATFSSDSRRRKGYLLISTVPLLLHFSSVSLCPTSRIGDPPGSPFFPLSTSQLSGFITTSARHSSSS